MRNLLRGLFCKHNFIIKGVYNVYDGTPKTVTYLECPHCKKKKKKVMINKIVMKQDIVA